MFLFFTSWLTFVFLSLRIMPYYITYIVSFTVFFLSDDLEKLFLLNNLFYNVIIWTWNWKIIEQMAVLQKKNCRKSGQIIKIFCLDFWDWLIHWCVQREYHICIWSTSCPWKYIPGVWSNCRHQLLKRTLICVFPMTFPMFFPSHTYTCMCIIFYTRKNNTKFTGQRAMKFINHIRSTIKPLRDEVCWDWRCECLWSR